MAYYLSPTNEAWFLKYYHQLKSQKGTIELTFPDKDVAKRFRYIIQSAVKTKYKDLDKFTMRVNGSVLKLIPKLPDFDTTPIDQKEEERVIGEAADYYEVMNYLMSDITTRVTHFLDTTITERELKKIEQWCSKNNFEYKFDNGRLTLIKHEENSIRSES